MEGHNHPSLGVRVEIPPFVQVQTPLHHAHWELTEVGRLCQRRQNDPIVVSHSKRYPTGSAASDNGFVSFDAGHDA